MAHYAFIKDNIVTEVITGKDETETAPDGFADWEEYYLTKRPGQDACKRTSYNTHANEHRLGGTAFRGNYAGKGFTYDSTKDAFIPPKPFASWTLNNTTCLWEPPVAMPSGSAYKWNESAYQADNTKGWEEITENLL